MANPKIFIRRSATPNKVPTSDQLALGELAINTNDGKLFLEKDPNGVGIGTTVVCVNPFNVGVGSLSYDINFTAGDVGIGTDDVSTAVGSNNTAVLAAGIVTAYKFYGGGLSLTDLGSENEILIVGSGQTVTSTSVLTIDNSNKYVGINQTSPDVTLHMTGEGAQTAQIRMEQYNDNADAPDVRIYRRRGTIASPADVQTGDYLFRLNVHGRDGGSDPIYHSLQMDVDSSDQDAGIVNLRTRDKDGNEANRIGIDKDGAIVFNDAYTFPTADGSANQVLSSDGSGNLSFSDIVGAAATVVMTSDPPSSPNSGDLWWDVDLGELFVYYSDGDSAQWVEANGGSILDITGKFVSNDTGIHTTRDVGIGTTTAGGAVHPNNDAVLNVGIVTANNIFGSEVEITSGDLTIPDSIVHRSDTNTKIRFPAADTITAETGGSERLRITSGGSVGFNTTLTQSSKTVHIAGDYRSVTQNVADEGLIFQSFTTASTGDVYPGISWTGNPTALGRARASINAIATNDNNGSDIVFLTRNAADGTELEVADDEKVRITSAGNVGVGTNNAEFLLDIQKDTDVSLRLKCNGTNSTDDTIIRNLIAGTSASNYIFFGDNADTNVGMIRYNHNDDSMRFTVGASERLRIHSDGHGEFYDGAVTRVLIADDVSMNSETTKSFPESGSGITFPSWATKITVVFYEISMSGTANILVRLNSNGSAINSNYSSGSANDTGSTNNTSTTGFVVINTNSSHVTSGRMVIERVGTDTKWVSSHTMVQNGTTPRHGAGRLSSYSGTIDGITVLDTGSNSFDGGTITVYAEA